MLNTRSLRIVVALLIQMLLIANPDAIQAQEHETDLGVGDLTGKIIEVTFQDFMSEGPYEVVKVSEGKQAGSISTLRVKIPGEKRNKTIRGKQVAELYVDHQPLDLVYDRKQRGLVFSPEKKAARLKKEKAVADRLRNNGHRLWEPLSESEQNRFLELQSTFVKNIQKEMPDVRFRLIDTQFFTVFTDISPEQVNGYLENLDAMYRELCGAFGVSIQKNVWCGKCVVVIFQNRADYMLYEAKVMGVQNPAILAGSAGLCHMFGNGEVKFAGFLGDNGGYFGNTLIHETTHGFIHRYLSSAFVDSWLNEGMAEWVADAIMKNDKIARRQKQSAQVVMAAGGWGDFLQAKQISGQHYGTASTLVDILLDRNKDGQFRRFVREIKEGKAIESSLKDTFGLTFKDLETLYVEWITRQ